jgi:colanic acid/amylovoran biosynthesis glycosyltransferase
MKPERSRFRLAVFVPTKDKPCETFIAAHLQGLPFDVLPRYGQDLAITDSAGRHVLPWGRLLGGAARRFTPRLYPWLLERSMARYLRTWRVDSVLAEFGPTGSFLAPACARAGVPLFVHFHGYDAYVHEILEAEQASYRRLFDIASGVISVSRAMSEKLLTLGVPAKRLHLNPYGVDPDRFYGGDPGNAPPTLLSVGRFVEKKAPHLTMLAFSNVKQEIANARLVFVGAGPLLGPCKRLAQALGLDDAVSFLGERSPEEVGRFMREARAFVQHSLVAENGDSEGTPVAVIEAQMTGLPVIATRHAGIPDVVIDGETGLLVEEGDALSMAARMRRVLLDSELAAKLGRSARLRAETKFTLDRHLSQLAGMIEEGIARAKRRRPASSVPR